MRNLMTRAAAEVLALAPPQRRKRAPHERPPPADRETLEECPLASFLPQPCRRRHDARRRLPPPLRLPAFSQCLLHQEAALVQLQGPSRSRHCRGEMIAISPCEPMGSRCARSPVTMNCARAATAAAMTWSSSTSSVTTRGTS